MDRPPFAAPPKARSEYRSSEEYTAALARYEAYQAWLQTRNPDGEATPPAEVEGEGGPNGSEGELGRGGAPKKKPRGAPFAKGGDPRRVQEGAKSFDELTDEEREALKDAAEAVLEEAKAKAKARKGKGKGKGKAEKAKAEGAEGAEGEGDADGEPSDDDLAEGLGMGGEAPEPPEGGLILLREQGMPMTGEEAMQFLHGVAQGALPSPQQFVQVMRAVAQQEVAEHGFEGFSEADLDAIMAAVKAAGAAAPKRVEVFRAPEAPKPDWSDAQQHLARRTLRVREVAPWATGGRVPWTRLLVDLLHRGHVRRTVDRPVDPSGGSGALPWYAVRRTVRGGRRVPRRRVGRCKQQRRTGDQPSPRQRQNAVAEPVQQSGGRPA
jgi:hypothetical protein